MQRLILIFFIASELCYYLLIAQTGIVEYFSSNLFLIPDYAIGKFQSKQTYYKI